MVTKTLQRVKQVARESQIRGVSVGFNEVRDEAVKYRVGPVALGLSVERWWA